jgi:serine/threonine protein kinase
MSDAHPQQRYRVLDRLASGGMAEVFLAESASIEGFKKRVAIKRVLPHLSEKTRFISMFLDEARLSAQLSHSNCVQVFDIGVGDSAYFIVMEYVDGADLKAIVEHLAQRRKPFPVELAVHVAIQICQGLAYAHELTGDGGTSLHVVHRDMSPPNVLITKYGEVKIVDFGLAKASSQLEKSEPGIIKGKFSYLSPEAALGEEIDHRTDIFAVGIILWEILSGKRLFVGESDFATVRLIQQAAVPSLRSARSDVPEDLERIILRALARSPSQRYSTARDLGRDLTSFLYRFSRPVSAFDLAELVRGATANRVKPAASGSVIDRLIEEALFEFTSLQDDGAAPALRERRSHDQARVGSENANFDDLGRLADELSSSGDVSDDESEMRASIARAAVDMGLGDLSAVEREPGRTSVGTSSLPQPPAPNPPPSATPRVTPAATRPAWPLYVAIAIVVAGALVGAWFAGLLGR